jgi:uncharacterized protein YutE (UPF0331/DUF86 family)
LRLVSCIRELSEALNDWERYTSLPLEQFRGDRDSRNMVLHAMLVTVQSSIDIATEIIAMKGLRRPASYRDTFVILAEEGVLARDLARHLSDLAGFRNVLVHSYSDLDLAQVYGILTRDLPVLREFLSEIKIFAHTV